MDFHEKARESGYGATTIFYFLKGKLTNEIIDSITFDQWQEVFETNKIDYFVAEFCVKRIEKSKNRLVWLTKVLANPNYGEGLKNIVLREREKALKNTAVEPWFLMKSTTGEIVKCLALQKMKELAKTDEEKSAMTDSKNTWFRPDVITMMKASRRCGFEQ